MKNHVEKLNQALHADNFDVDALRNLLLFITEQEKVRLRVLDFEYFNEQRLSHVTKKKLEAIKAWDFESAALWRDKERKVLEYMEIRKELNIQQSGFHYDKGYLFYSHLGTAKNDNEVIKILSSMGL
jgi:type 1 glutamine amidotransferase